MKRVSALAISLGVSLALLTGCVEPVVVPEGFHSSYKAALEQARQDNKPLFLFFTMEGSWWHGTGEGLRWIEKEGLAHEKVKANLAHFVSVSIDASDGRDGDMVWAVRAKIDEFHNKFYRFGVGSSIPFFAILAPDGTVLDTDSQGAPLDDIAQDDFIHRFVEWISKGSQTFQRYAAFVEKARTADPDSKNLDFQLEAMELYVTLRQWDNAAAAVEAVLELDKDRQHLAATRLAQLRIARATFHYKTDRLIDFDAVDNLVVEIRTLDPENGGHFLEDALAEQLGAVRDQTYIEVVIMKSRPEYEAYRMPDPLREKTLAICIERAALPNLRDPVEAKWQLACWLANFDRFSEARALMEKTVADHPDCLQGPHARIVKYVIEWVTWEDTKQKTLSHPT